jgi:hypothetical protein
MQETAGLLLLTLNFTFVSYLDELR